MADYRQIHTCIWKDSWFIELPQEYKLLFIYLFSNERANLTGLYDLSLKVIAFEADLAPGVIEAGLEHFARAGKIFYDDGMIWVPTLLRHNVNNIASPKIQTHIRSIISDTRDCPLKARWIDYYNAWVPSRYRFDTASIPNPKSESEQEQEQEQDHEQEQEQEQDHHQEQDAPARDPVDNSPPALLVVDDDDALLQELLDAGIAKGRAREIVSRCDPLRIGGWIDWVHANNGKVRDPPAFLCHMLLKTEEDPPRANSPPDRNSDAWRRSYFVEGLTMPIEAEPP